MWLKRALNQAKHYADAGAVEDDDQPIPASDLPMGPRGVPLIDIGGGPVAKQGQQIQPPPTPQQVVPTAQQVGQVLAPETTKALTQPAPPPPSTDVAPGKIPQGAEGTDYVPAGMEAAAFMLPGPEGILGSAVEGAEKVVPAAEKAFGIAPEEFAQWVKTGGQEGSNPGGWFANPADSTNWYVKTPKDENQARQEVLANKLYSIAGVPVPRVELTKTPAGKVAVASQEIPGAVPLGKSTQIGATLGSGTPPTGLIEHFPADAWLANWDTIGLDYDNIMIGQNGWGYRIDHGGALDYRAQGGLKGDKFGYDVPEFESLRDPKINPQSAAVFKRLEDYQGVDFRTAEKIAAIPNQSIIDLVHQYLGHNDAADTMAVKLISRRDDLAEKYGAMKANPLDVSDAKLDTNWPPSGMTPGSKSPSEATDIEDVTDAPAWLKGGPEWGGDYEDQLASQVSQATGVPEVLPAQTEDYKGPGISDDEWEDLKNQLSAAAKGLKAPTPTLMQINKTHSAEQLVNALKDSGYGDVDPKKMTSKQQVKVAGLMDAKPADQLATFVAKLSALERANIYSWLGKKQQQAVTDALTDLNKKMPIYKKNGYSQAEIEKYYTDQDIFQKKVAMEGSGELADEVSQKPPVFKPNIIKGKPGYEPLKPGLPQQWMQGWAFHDKQGIPLKYISAIEPIEKTNWKSWANYRPAKFTNWTPLDIPNAELDKLINEHNFSALQLMHRHNYGEGKFPQKGFLDPKSPEYLKSQGWSEPALFALHRQTPYYGSHTTKFLTRGEPGKVGFVDWPELVKPGAGKLTAGYDGNMHPLIVAGHNEGYDMLIVKGINDMEGPDPGSYGSTQYVILNPAIIRGSNANFNPALLHKAMPLWGVVGGFSFTYGMMRGEKEKPNPVSGMARGGRAVPLKPGGGQATIPLRPGSKIAALKVAKRYASRAND